MAKLFRHFGLGGGSKKGSSGGQDLTAKTSGGSVQELRLKSPTKYRSSAIVTSSPPSAVHGRGTVSGDHRSNREGDLDVRRHSDASSVRTLRPKTPGTDWSPVHVGGASGGREKPRDGRSGSGGTGNISHRGAFNSPSADDAFGRSGVPALGRGESLENGGKGRTQNICDDGSGESRISAIERTASVTSLTLPSSRTSNGVNQLLISDYSDPFDLKRQNAATAAAQAEAESKAKSILTNQEKRLSDIIQSEDEYSVPYEVKEQIKALKLKEQSGATGLPDSTSTPTIPITTSDSDTYADPYEGGPALFSLARRSAAGDKQTSAAAGDDPQCLLSSSTTTETGPTKKDGISQSNLDSSGAGDSVATYISDNRAASEKQNSDNTSATNTSDVKQPDVVTRLDVEKNTDGSAPCERDGSEFVIGFEIKSPGEVITGGGFDDGGRSFVTYDEPWDLGATRRGIEDRLKMAARQYAKETEGGGWGALGRSPPGVTGGSGAIAPPQEYDEPWDRKARDIERNLIVAKSAKEAARMMMRGDGVGGSGGAGDHRSCRIDERTTDEYYDDRRIVSSSGGGATSGAAGKEQGGNVSSPHHSPSSHGLGGSVGEGNASSHCPSCSSAMGTGHSPKRKWNIDTNNSPWCNLHAERVDPKIPLEQQGWFHGAISRVDAETLLRVHREGSYLVRTSESNRSDYSLSLKSPNGFLHMKIVDHDGQLILGQFSQPFDDIPQMIHFFTMNKLPIHGADHMFLLFPVHNELL